VTVFRLNKIKKPLVGGLVDRLHDGSDGTFKGLKSRSKWIKHVIVGGQELPSEFTQFGHPGQEHRNILLDAIILLQMTLESTGPKDPYPDYLSADPPPAASLEVR
jgi:hypothetical protein